MKTIGVIGGIGPQATMDFEARVHRAAQRRLEPRMNSGYPPMLVYYHRRAPFVLGEDNKPRVPLQLDPELRQALARLGPLVDFLVVTANGPHLLAAEIERAAGRPVLSMVDRTLDEVRQRKWNRVGVLTLGRPTVYAERLDRLGIAHKSLAAEQQPRLDDAIFRVMEGREDDADRAAAREAIETLRRSGVDGVIIGCTELPMLLQPSGKEPDLINPAQVLADAAVEFAMQ